ncbi:MAG TPA: hypothetical protein VEB66_13340 [Opitutaceae bacterium]|nr:hypothetical protein [Opitutaceae bacterium]
MMTDTRFRPLKSAGAIAALAFAASVSAQSPAPVADGPVGIRITEQSLLRTLVITDEASRDIEQHFVRALVERDFAVQEDTEYPSRPLNAAAMKEAGERANADLVIYATVEDRKLDSYGGTHVYRAQSTIRAVNRATGETLSINPPGFVRGQRSSSEDIARENARNAAIEKGVDEALKTLMARAHRMMIYKVALVGVFSETQLLKHMEDIGKLKGVYYVKRLEFDRRTNEALLEVIATPGSQAFWRAYVEQMPKVQLLGYDPNMTVQNHYPAWFQPEATK